MLKDVHIARPHFPLAAITLLKVGLGRGDMLRAVRVTYLRLTVARELARQQDDYYVLAADTTITLDGDIIGKPTDREQCRCILEQLSARQHLVLSAVALATADDVTVRLVQNRVSFRAISAAEIASYCACDEPMDKAGAYAIQGKAAIFIEYLEGSYSAVMGLPLYETAELLRGAGIELY